jgi:hypothetical protein
MFPTFRPSNAISRVSLLALTAILALQITNGYAQTGSTTGTTADNFQNQGASGATFTKLWVGARASAMAGAFSALADDVTGLYWNPAGIARLPGINAGATHSELFAGITQNFIGATMPLSDRYRVGISLNEVDYGDIRRTTLTKPANGGNYNANDLAFGVTIAGALTDRFAFGATAKYLRNSILDLSADGFAFDASSLYQTDFYHMKIALDLTNLGTDRSFEGNSLTLLANGSSLNQVQTPVATKMVTSDFPLPLIFRIGGATDILQGTVENQVLNLAFDFSTHSDGPEVYNLGGEYVYDNMVALRAGYAFNEDQLGLGAGAGFRYKSEDFSGTVDYALNTTRSLGLIHRISISAVFQ